MTSFEDPKKPLPEVQTQLISEVLANLILQRDVPYKAVAIAGEAIALDARLRGFDERPIKSPSSFEDLGWILEAYSDLVIRTRYVVSEFLKHRDMQALVLGLSEIKQALADFEPIPLGGKRV